MTDLAGLAQRVAELERDLADARERERRLLQALDGVGHAFFVARLRDGELRIEHRSPQLAALHGLEPAALERDSLAWLDSVHPEDRPAMTTKVREAPGPAGLESEYRVVREACVRWMRVRVASSAGPADALVVGVVTDVTEVRDATERLRRSAAQLRSVIDAIPSLLAFVDPAQRYIVANERYATWFGSTPEGLVGRSMAEVFGQELATSLPYVRRALAGEPVSFERRMPAQDDGTLRDLDVRYVPQVEDGRVRGVVMLAEDVTERRRAEIAVREREERLSLVLEGSEDGFWDWDVITGATFFSARAESMLGYSPGEVEPHVSAWERLLHPDDAGRALGTISEHLAGRSAGYTLDCRMLRRSGEWTWVQVRGRVVRRDAQGRPLRATGTSHDLTARKAAEDALRRSNRALRVISGMNSALIRVAQEDRFLAEVCWVLVGVAGYPGAWFGFAAADGLVRVAGHAGVRDPALAGLGWREGEGPVGRAIRTGEVQVEGPSGERRATLVAPIRLQGQVVGALTILASGSGALDAEERELVGEVARDLEFGLEALRTRAEREQVAAAQRESEGRFRGIFQHAALGIALLDEQGRVLEANPRLREMLGFGADGPGLSEQLALARPAGLFQELLRGRRPRYELERRYTSKGGATFHGRVTASLVRFKDPTTGALVVEMIEDLGPIQAAQALTAQRLREEEAVSQAALEALAGRSHEQLEGQVCGLVAGALCADLVGILDVQPSGGLRLRTGKGWGPAAPGVAAVPVVPGGALDRALRTGLAIQLDGSFPAELAALGVADGVVAPVAGSRGPLALLGAFSRAPGPLTGSQRFLSAIASILALARRRAESDSALERSNTLLEAAKGDLARDERLRALGHLASGIAHDFNNHLTPILGFTDLLLENAKLVDDPKVRRYLASVKTAAEGAGRVVARLREFYRVRQGGDPIALVDPNQVMLDAMSLAAPKWRDDAQMLGKPVRFENALVSRRRIAGNVHELRDALLNLILNAVDALGERGGTVSLRARDDGSEVVLEVRDDGCGMTEAVRSRCFEPFFTTKGEHGSGLGLAQVWGVTQRHHGAVLVDSAPGRGTVITLRFPAREPSAVPQTGPTPRPLRSLRILVVDDEAGARDMIRDALALDGHTPIVVDTGAAALERLRAGGVDLLLTDRSMPGLNGDQLAAEARTLDGALPIVMLTGYGEFMNELERPPGVDLVLSKPITVEGLRRGVAKVLALHTPAT